MTLREHRQEVLMEKLEPVAARSGLSVAVLSRIERGKKPSPYRIADLARGYCLTIDGIKPLLGDSKDETKKQGLHKARRVSRKGSRSTAVGNRKAS